MLTSRVSYFRLSGYQLCGVCEHTRGLLNYVSNIIFKTLISTQIDQLFAILTQESVSSQLCICMHFSHPVRIAC